MPFNRKGQESKKARNRSVSWIQETKKETENRGSKLCTDTSTLSDSDQGERELILKVSEANAE